MKVSSSLFLLLCAGGTHAAGFALVEHGASALGNAYAGAAATAADASTVWHNPAGMTLLPERQLAGALHLIRPQIEFRGETVPAQTGGNGGDAGKFAAVPNGFYAMRLSPRLSFGVGMSTPFGLATEYDEAWQGRFHAVKSKLETLNLNPALAWQASATLALGAGLNVQFARAALTNTLPAPGQPLASVKGDDHAFGWNVGALWQVRADTRIGIAYRSELDYRLQGELAVNGTETPAFARVTVPDSAALSLWHRVDRRWELMADVSWTGWNDFDELRIQREADGTTLALTPERWHNARRYALGANYRYSDALLLRGGVALDESPVPGNTRTARIPDADRTWLAFGAQLRLSPASRLDVGYAHLFFDDTRIDETVNGIRLVGQYRGAADLLSAQLTLDL